MNIDMHYYYNSTINRICLNFYVSYLQLFNDIFQQEKTFSLFTQSI